MNKSLEYLLEKFPDYRAKLILLYNKNEDFRILCDDYFTSSQAIEEYRLNVISNSEVENEYSKVYIDLEKEIIHLLSTKRK